MPVVTESKLLDDRLATRIAECKQPSHPLEQLMRDNRF